MKPFFRFGLISDIQYADVEDRSSAVGKRRHYRSTLEIVKSAIKHWNEESVDFALHCGDIIDSLNKKQQTSEYALERVLDAFKALNLEMKHVTGNHCIGQFDRQSFYRKLGFEGDIGYYSFSPYKDWKIIVLDSTDLSLYGWPEDHPHYQMAYSLLEKNNTSGVWHEPGLLTGLTKRFCNYNGGMGQDQLKWLENELDSSRRLQERVLIFTHIPINPDLVMHGGLLWNYDEVLKLVHSYSSVVQAVISGHVHYWSYNRDEKGIHHFSIPGIIEMPPGTEGHGIVDVHHDRLVVNGFDRSDPFVMHLRLQRHSL